MLRIARRRLYAQVCKLGKEIGSMQQLNKLLYSGASATHTSSYHTADRETNSRPVYILETN